MTTDQELRELLERQALEWLTGLSLSPVRASDFVMLEGQEVLTAETAIQAMVSFALSRTEQAEARVKELEAEFHRRGIKIVEMTEFAGAHLCRAEKAVSALKDRDDEIARLRGALQLAADRFREYAASHAAKGTYEANLKAHRNLDMAQTCDAALHPKGGKAS